MKLGSGINKCPECSGTLGVTDTRNRSFGRFRRRKCDNCDYRVSTVEVPQETLRKLARLAKAVAAFDSAVIDAGVLINGLAVFADQLEEPGHWED